MPRYFFDIDNGSDPHVDSIGHDLPDDEAARWAGLDTLPDVARDQIAHSDHRTFGVVVRNAEGTVIYAATLALMGGWKNHHPKKRETKTSSPTALLRPKP